jgi:hypothetical protein
MTTALLVMTDGRSYIHEAIESAESALVPRNEIIERYIHDDSGSEAHAMFLGDLYPNWTIISSGHRSGFGGAIRNAWNFLRQMTEADYIFHLEDDFTFNRQVDLLALQTVLRVRPNVCQVALRRQPWNREERRAGGIVEMRPEAYAEHSFMEATWLEHTEFFTTNPCLYRRELISLVWPDGPESEGRFGIGLKAVGRTFAFYGARDSGEWVTHIGRERAGEGY